MFEDLSRGVKNELAVVGGVLSNAPGAIWDELSKDFSKERRGALVAREAGAFGIAAAAGVALQRMPSFAKFGLGALGALQGLRLVSGISGVLGDAWDADSAEQRGRLVNRATGTFSREAAAVIETTPAFLAGGGAGMLAGRRIRPLDSMAFSVADKTSWIGPRTERLPAGLMAKDGNINLIELSNELAKRHAWTGVEVGRSVRLTDLKAGRPVSGNALGFEAAFPDRMNRVMFHTQPPIIDRAMTPGARPSVKDVLATADTGVVQSGRLTTVYEGLVRQRAALGSQTAPTLRAVVFDHHNRLAVQLENVADMAKLEWLPATPRVLDYSQAVKVFSNWNRHWSQIDNIPASLTAELDPAALRLLKLGV